MKPKGWKQSIFGFQELIQMVVGNFTAILLFFALRGGDSLSFNPNHGLLITIFLVVIYYQGLEMKYKNANFAANLIVSFLVSALMANTFILIEPSIIWTYDVFGSAVIVGVWLGFARSLLFDKFDFTNPLKRQYVNGGKKIR